MKQYLETRLELVFALKKGTTFSSLAPFIVNTDQAEGVFVVDVEGTFLGEPKKKVLAFTSASTSSLVFLLSRCTQTTQAALASLRAPPNFDPLHKFQLYLKE